MTRIKCLTTLFLFLINSLCAFDTLVFRGDVPGLWKDISPNETIKWEAEYVLDGQATYDEGTGTLTLLAGGSYRVKINLVAEEDVFVANLGGNIQNINNNEMNNRFQFLANGQLYVFNGASFEERVHSSSKIEVYRVTGEVAIDADACEIPVAIGSNLPFCAINYNNKYVSYDSSTSTFTFLKEGAYNISIQIRTEDDAGIVLAYGVYGSNFLDIVNDSDEGQVNFDYVFYPGMILYLANFGTSVAEIERGSLTVTELSSTSKKRRRHRHRCVCECHCPQNNQHRHPKHCLRK